MAEKWKCLTCGKVFDQETAYHYPPKGYKRPYPNLPVADPGCGGRVVKIGEDKK